MSWRGLARSAVGEVSNFDAPLTRTLRDLTLHPGRTCREYLAGRRRGYIEPVKYVLLTATFILLAYQLRGSGRSLPSGSPDEQLRARVFATVLGFWGYYLFVMLVPVAQLQALLFRSLGRTSAECYVFDLYVFGHILWFNLASALFGIPSNSAAGVGIQLAQLTYVIAALKGFYETGLLRAVASGVALYAAYATSAVAMGFITHAVLRLFA